MAKSTFHRPPAGARDLLPLDVEQKQWVEARLRQRFEQWGYRRIISPTLERLETLTAGGTVELEAMLQVRDAEGTMLGLRPELTASIARAAATRMAGATLPLRLYYNAAVFRNAQREQEFFQAGVELLGAPGWLADAEVLLLLADCLQLLQVPQWTVVLGDVGLTQGLLSVLSPSAHAQVRRAIATLDRVYLETAPLSERDRQCGLQVLDLRGTPAQVLTELSQMSLPANQLVRVGRLQHLCDLLTAQQIPIVLDLSLLQTFGYYTGVVFEVVAGREQLGLGGRYDHLYELYSPTQMPQAGIGFSLTLEALQRVLQPTGQLPMRSLGSDCLLVPLEAAAVPAMLDLAHTWRSQPSLRRVEIELLGEFSGADSPRSVEAIAAYARDCGIAEIVWVQVDGTYHTTSVELPLQEPVF